MKKTNAKKIVAIFMAVNFAFFQAVPFAGAANAPAVPVDLTIAPVSEKSATEATENPAPEPVPAPATTTDFQMDNGGLSKSDSAASPVSPEAAPAVQQPVAATETLNQSVSAEVTQNAVNQEAPAQTAAEATANALRLESVIQTYLENDQVIDRTEMLLVFSRITADDVVSQEEYEILKKMQDHPELYPELEYVRDLADSVMFDLRNSMSQGTADSLPSASALNTFVNKWFRGSENPETSLSLLASNSDNDGVNSLGSDNPGTSIGTYTQTVGRLFVDGVTYQDIVQGSVGDCYFMAALAELAFRDSGAIYDMFIDNHDGTFTVRFFRHSRAEYVTVDRQLPVDERGRFVYANHEASAYDPNAELWTALAEKAYVKMVAKWDGRQNGHYWDIDGGHASDVLAQITNRCHDVTVLTAGAGVSTLAALWSVGALMTLSSRQSPQDSRVRGHHAYAIVGYDAVTKMVSIFNPWGIGYGLLTLSLKAVSQNFKVLQWVNVPKTIAITNIYRTFLGRDPDPEGLAGWNNSGLSIEEIRRYIIVCPERLEKISEMYRQLLGREPEANAAYDRASTGQSLAEIRSNIYNSPEAQAFRRIQSIATIYRTLLGREPDPNGLSNWNNSGLSLQAIEQQIMVCPERVQKIANMLRQAFGQVPEDIQLSRALNGALSRELAGNNSESNPAYDLASSGLSLADVRSTISNLALQRRQSITNLYRMFLDHDPDPAGLEGWHRSGLSVRKIEEQIVVCPERLELIAGMYREFLGREPEANAAYNWAASWQLMANIRSGIYNSAEAQARRRIQGITNIYQTFLGRDPDPNGLAHQNNSGLSLQEIEQNIMLCPERLQKIANMLRQTFGQVPEDFKFRTLVGSDPEANAAYDLASSGRALADIRSKIEGLASRRIQSITNLYQIFLGRDLDPTRLEDWHRSGLSLRKIEEQIVVCPERLELIAGMYREFLGREPEANAAYNWAASWQLMADIRSGIYNSAEAQARRRIQGITNIYQTFLGREPDPDGLAHQNNSGLLLQGIERNIILCPERLELIAGMYREFLGREPEANAAYSWASSGQSLADIRSGIYNSSEARVFRRVQSITDIYKKLLGRNPDPNGLANWNKSGLRIEEIERQIKVCPERLKKITRMYQAFLGREPEANAAYSWASSGQSLADIRSQIYNIPEAQKWRSLLVS